MNALRIAGIIAFVGGATGALGFAAGCAKDPMYEPVPGGAGAAGGTGTSGAPGIATGGSTSGGGGASGAGGGSPTFVCSATRSALGNIDAPAPWVSVGKPTVSSAGVTNPGKAVDGVYAHDGTFFPAPTEQAPGWLAIDVGVGPERLLLAWADTGWNDYNTPIPGAAPASYRLETSADSTDGVDGVWQIVVTVTANKVRERAHTFAFKDQRWVKLVVTGAANVASVKVGVSLDEIALYDVTQTAAARPADTWLFMGDSITAGAFRRQLGPGTTFEALVKAQRPGYSPLVLNAGIGGELSTQGVGHVTDWLATNPDITHVPILYGTNDSWDVSTATSPNLTNFTNALTRIVEALLADGRVPILARIPYASMHHARLDVFNTAIDVIGASHDLPCGPDLYTWFKNHPEELSDDGVHPSDIGYRSINRLWAESMLGRYPTTN